MDQEYKSGISGIVHSTHHITGSTVVHRTGYFLTLFLHYACVLNGHSSLITEIFLLLQNVYSYSTYEKADLKYFLFYLEVSLCIYYLAK